MAQEFVTKLTLDAQEFIGKMQAASKSVEGISQGFKQSTDAAKESLGAMKSALAQMIASGQGSTAEADKLRTSLKSAVDESNKLSDAMKKVEAEMKATASSAADVGAKGGGAIGGLMDKFKEGQTAAGAGGGMFGSLAGSIGSMASPIGAATAALGALAAGFSFVMDVGQKFEDKAAELSAVTGQSGAALDDLKDRARGLATQFGGSASDQLDSFTGILSKIGPQLADTPEALTSVANSVNLLSKASGDDAATSMNNLTSAMLQYGVNVNDSAQVAARGAEYIDVMTQSANLGSASIKQVAESINVAGGVASGANISFTETNAAIQTFAKGALTGSEAGNALKNVILKMQTGSNEAEKTLKKIGLSFKEMGSTVNTEGMTAALTKLQGGLSKLGSDAERTTALNSLFGSENIRGAQTLLNNLDSMQGFVKGLGDSNGKALEAANIRMATFSEQMKRGKAGMEDFALGVYESIKPALSAVTKEIFDFVSDLMGGIKRLASQLAPLLQPLVYYVGGVLAVAFTVAKNIITTAINIIIDIVTRVGEIITPVFDEISRAFAGVGKSAGSFDDVKAVIADFYDIIQLVAKFIYEVFVTAFQAIVGVVRIVISYFTGVGDATKQMSGKAEEGTSIFQKLHNVLNNIKGTVGGVTEGFKALKDIVGEAINAIAHLDLGKLSSIFSNAGKKLGDAYNEGFNESTGKTIGGKDAAQVQEEQKNNYLKLLGVIDQFKKEAGKLSAQEIEERKKAIHAKYDNELSAMVDAHKLSKDQAKSFKDTLDSIEARGTGKEGLGSDKAEKKKKEHHDTELQRINKEIADFTRKEMEKVEAVERAEKKIAASRGDFELDNAQMVKIALAKSDAMAAIAKQTASLLTTDGKVSIKLDSSKGETESAVQKIVNDAQEEALDAELAFNKFKLDPKAFKTSLKTYIHQAEESLSTDSLVSAGIKKGEEAAISSIERLKEFAEAVRMEGNEDGYRDAMEAASKLEDKLQKNLVSAKKEEREITLASIDDEQQRAIAKKIFALEDERDKVVKSTLGTAEQRKAIEIRLNSEIAALRNQQIQETKSGYEQLADSITSAFSNIKIDFSIKDDGAAQKIKDELAKITEEQQNNVAARIKGSASIQETAKKEEALIEKKKKLEEELADTQISAFKRVKNAIKEAFETQAKVTKDVSDKAVDAYSKQADILEKVRKDRKAGVATEAQETKATEDAAKAKEAAFASLGSAIGTNLVAMAAAGASFGEIMKKTAGDAARGLLKIYTPEILAAATGLLGPIAGPIVGGLAIAGFNALLAAEGFEGGGFTGLGANNEAAGIVHRNEFVANAGLVAREKPLFEFLHKGGSSMEYLTQRQDLSQLHVNRSGRLESTQALQDIHALLAGDQQRAISVKSNADVQVVLDDRRLLKQVIKNHNNSIRRK